MEYIDGRYEYRLYVEGCDTSAGINDTELKVTYTRDSINFIDRLKLTVVDVVIDEPAADEAVAVLISKTPGMGDEYPEPELQTQDRLIRIKAHTEPSVPDLPVHFKVWDPDDESPYEEDSLGDDNADGLGTIYAVPGYGYEGEPGPSLVVYSDPNGNIKVKLEITDHAAGDNYFVTACAMKQPHETDDASGKMIAWKRVYLEIDRMFRRGADLQSDAEPGDTVLYVTRLTDDLGKPLFEIGQSILLFDSSHEEAHVMVEVFSLPGVPTELPHSCLRIADPVSLLNSAGNNVFIHLVDLHTSYGTGSFYHFDVGGDATWKAIMSGFERLPL